MANGLFNLKQVMQAVQQGGWPNQKTPAVEYLVVAGGGGGARSQGVAGGGGGAGGLLTGIDPVPNGQTLLVTVGAGGNGGTSGVLGTVGGNSVFSAITATGGGYGGQNTVGVAGVGGSGGGGASYANAYIIGSAGTSGQGNAGGNGVSLDPQCSGGGGGAGTIGFNGFAPTNAGNGGAGIASAITGTVTSYAGGGGGGAENPGTAGVGGVGGGGAGAVGAGTAGTTNTGGGGGGSGYNGGEFSGAAGGSGLVAISYPDVYAAATATTGSPTVSTSGSGSLSFNGSTQYVNVTTNQSSFAFGSSDFTIEGWYYFNNVTSEQEIFDFRPLSTQGAYPMAYVWTDSKLYYWVDSANRITSSITLSTGTWYHIAICRSGTVTKMFINGTQTGSGYTDTNNYLVGANRPTFGVNAFQLNIGFMNGYMSNIRVNNTTAIYTTSFTPSNTPLTAISGTVLLLNIVSGAYLADSSSLSNTLAVGVAPTWNQLSPFTGTGYKNRVYTWTSSGSITF